MRLFTGCAYRSGYLPASARIWPHLAAAAAGNGRPGLVGQRPAELTHLTGPRISAGPDRAAGALGWPMQLSLAGVLAA